MAPDKINIYSEQTDPHFGKLTPYENDTPKGTWLTVNNERLF